MNVQIDHLHILFLEKLSIQLGLLGFTLNYGEVQTFRRKVEIGDYYLHVFFHGFSPAWTVTVHIGISCYPVEELYADIRGEPYRDDESRIGTIGADLKRLVPNDTSLEWSLRNLSGVNNVANDIVTKFLEFGLPQLRKFQTLADLSEPLGITHRMTEKLSLESPIDSERGRKAVVLSFLIGDDSFRHVVEREKKFFGKREVDYLSLMEVIQALDGKEDNNTPSGGATK